MIFLCIEISSVFRIQIVLATGFILAVNLVPFICLITDYFRTSRSSNHEWGSTNVLNDFGVKTKQISKISLDLFY